MGGDQVGVIGVLGTKEGAACLDEVALERDGPVDEGGHDVAVAWLRDLEDDGVTVQDAGTDHGVPPHLEGEGLRIPGQADHRGIQLERFLGILFLSLGNSGGDHAVEGDLQKFRSRPEIVQHNVPGATRLAADDPLFLHQVEMARHGRRGTESESCHDLPDRGNASPILRVGADEREDFVLSGRESHMPYICSV